MIQSQRYGDLNAANWSITHTLMVKNQMWFTLFSFKEEYLNNK